MAPAIDLDHVVRVRLLFDRTPAGSIVLDNLGFSRISRDFLIANDK